MPLAEWLEWSAGLTAVAAGEANLSGALAQDRALLRGRLREFLARPEVRDAYFVAAPDLDARLHVWQDAPDSPRGLKIEQSLVRYWARMAARPTPFGLFAGCSVGPLGDTTRLVVAPLREGQRHTRLDADYLFALIEKLKADKDLQEELTCRPNSSLYRAAGRVRYVEARLDGKNRSYHLVALDDTPYLAATLSRARDGATVRDLAAALCSDEITLEQARKYIADLIAAQVLAPDLALALTGPEAIHPLITELQKHAATQATAQVLQTTRDALDALDRAGVGVAPARYQAIAEQLKQLPAPVEMARLFQVDLLKPAPDAVLGQAVVDAMRRGLQFFRQRAQTVQPEVLKRFADKFTARYEEQEIPLLEALDEENGIGLDAGTETTPLLKGVAFAVKGADGVAFGAWETFLLNRLADIWRSGATELVLDEKDWEKFARAEPALLPDALVVQATLAAEGPEALARDEFQLVWQGAAGPSGARLLGRFCHADPQLHDYVVAHLRAEEAHRPDAVFAEIVHLPAGRMGNVLARPVLRDYEIAYLGCSGATEERRIEANDLLVSVRGGRIRLRSQRLGREVIPRLTNAHNYGHFGLGVYRFLGLLQDQNSVGGLSWSWGPLGGAAFLPRVRVGRLVLALAQWQVTKEELAQFAKLKETELFRAVQEWRAVRRLPRLITLRDADNVLPLDLDNVLSVESFAQMVHTRQSATLKEFFPAPEQLCASSAEGLLTHELVVPFVKKQGAETLKHSGAEREKSAIHPPNSAITRSFTPGSDWLYVQIYTGTATADRLLREAMWPLLAEMKSREAIQNWHFIRYGDPDWHLRLRWQGDPQRLRDEVQPLLVAALQPWLASSAARRVQFSTYQREIERYGGPAGIELAEQLFSADSAAVLEIITMLEPGDAGLHERWRLVCAGMDLLLQDFGLTLAEKYELWRGLHDGFAKEFKADKAFHGQLGEKFRQERRSLAELLVYDDGHPLAPGIAVLRRRSDALAPLVAKLHEAAGAGRLTKPLNEILASYLHIHANRLLRSAQRQQELVIYDLLTRHYDSLQAREKGPGKRAGYRKGIFNAETPGRREKTT